VTTLLLVRHASTDWVGKGLAGRSDAPLSLQGRAESARLTTRLAASGPDVILSSPRRRCLDTAAPVAAVLGLEPIADHGLDEIDFGDWTGRTFESLGQDEGWLRWNAHRSGTRCPGGESMAEAQCRVIDLCQRLAAERPSARALLFSHADVIRGALAFWLGMPLDLILRLEVAPASISTVELGPWGPRVVGINETLGPEPGNGKPSAARPVALPNTTAPRPA
jgi:broad specificity phosphatase PhoE